MTDHELEQRLRSWYQAEIPADEAAPAALRSRLAAIPRVVPVPLGERRPGRPMTLLAAAAILATAIVGGAMLSGSDLFRGLVVPPPDGTSTVAPFPSGPPSARPAANRIVYTESKMLRRGEEDCTSQSGFCARASVFVSNTDGSDPHEIVAGPYSTVLGASPDGSRILVSVAGDDPGVKMTDWQGTEPEVVDTGCRLPCIGDYGFALSPDGIRLAFARDLGNASGEHSGSVIAVMDLTTRVVTQLDATVTSNPDLGDPCHSNCGEGENWGAVWSPDGANLLVIRGGIGIPDQPRMFLDSAIFIVGVDGSNLRQLTPLELHATYAQWSLDGGSIAFQSSIDTLAAPGIDNWQQLNDIYSIRPDGTDLVRLTSDTIGDLGTIEPGEFGARFPNWTHDGRLVFTRNAEPGEGQLQVWVMNGDGTGVLRIGASDATALTSIGCVTCPYPAVPVLDVRPSPAFWIRVP